MLCGGGVSDFGLLWSDANLRDACIRVQAECNVASNRIRVAMLACVCAHVQSMGYIPIMVRYKYNSTRHYSG